MNFQNLEYFLAAARELNMTRAAEELHISQQALSNHIIKLEQELSCQLFDRSHGLTLTYSGKQLEKSASQILDLKHQALQAISDINQNERGELRIGISHTRGQAILPFLLPEYQRTHPLVELSILEGSSLEIEEWLAKGQADVIIGYAPFLLESCESKELMKERMYLLAPKDYLKEKYGKEEAERLIAEYRQKPDISLFGEEPFVMLEKGDRIRALMEREFYLRGLKPKILVETENIQTACALCAEGMGFTVCPEIYLKSRFTIVGEGSYIRSKIEVLDFYENKEEDSIAIGYSRERYLSRAAEEFISMSMDTCRRIYTK